MEDQSVRVPFIMLAHSFDGEALALAVAEK